MKTKDAKKSHPKNNPVYAAGAMIVAAAVLLASCGKSNETSAPPPSVRAAPALPAPSTGDPYDVTKMDFKPSSAAITPERHKDAFAAGNALNMEATLKPVAPEAVKEIQLDTTHKIIEIAPGDERGSNGLKIARAEKIFPDDTCVLIETFVYDVVIPSHSAKRDHHGVGGGFNARDGLDTLH